MPDINISVKNKIAVQTNKTEYICDNSDFIIKFNFDAEWDAYDTKTARFCYNSKYVDAVFTGDSCAIPIISDTNDISIGVYAGNLHTTTPALVLCEKSILGGSGFPADPPDDVYNQIMELIQGLGTPDAEAIAKAVADYLIKNPLEETDPTVPEWAKAENKPTYTAEEVGAEVYYVDLTGNYPNYTCPVAMADIKAAYEAGKKLQCRCAMGMYTATLPLFVPMPSANTWIFSGSGALTAMNFPAQSLTIAIVNGTVWASNTRLATLDDISSAALTLGLTGATVGQIAKIAAVNESGVPTAWEPVDMPSGGGEEWRKVIDAEVTEPTAEFIRDGLNGATELHIAWSNLQNASTKDSGLSVKINNILVSTYQTAASVQKNGSTIYGWTHLKFDGLHWMLCKSAGALYAENISQSIAYTIYNLVENVGAANTIKFEAPTMQYAPISGKLEVWAR